MENQYSSYIELIEERVNKFLGYGNYEGKFWFVGIEERGGDTIADFINRINTWSRRGKPEIDDVAEYHIELGGCERLFIEETEKPIIIQPTWGRLIRILLNAKTAEDIRTKDIKEDIREYQRSKLGRLNQETCLLELFGLPAPPNDIWILDRHFKPDWLLSKKDYIKHCVEKRISDISEKIKKHNPKSVVFYGSTYREYWKDIAKGIEFLSTPDGFLIGTNKQTVFIIAKHPVARGVGYEYLNNIGREIRDKIS